MRNPKIVLGKKLFLAEIIDVEKGDRLIVTEYTVTKAGEHRFEVRSKRGRRAGAYSSMGRTLGALQETPLEAVKYLELSLAVEQKEAIEHATRLVRRNTEWLQLTTEWRNQQHGL